MNRLARQAVMASMAVWTAGSPLPAGAERDALDRARVSAEILSRWSAGLEDGGAELAGALARLSTEALGEAARAQSPDEVNAAIFGRRGPQALGDEDSDLVYFPLAPCRLVDTRAIPTGPSPIAAGTTRAFSANVSSRVAAQGGAAAGCGVPGLDPAALVLTIAAVNPVGPGNLRAYATGSPLPTASVLNYGLPGSGLNLTNTTIVPILQNAFNPNQFNIRADSSTVDVVIDVVGYFFSPLRTPPACQTVVATGTIPANSSLLLYSPFCPVGTALTGGGYATGLLTTQVWVAESSPQGNQWLCRAISTRPTGLILGCFARCCSLPGR